MTDRPNLRALAECIGTRKHAKEIMNALPLLIQKGAVPGFAPPDERQEVIDKINSLTPGELLEVQRRMGAII